MPGTCIFWEQAGIQRAAPLFRSFRWPLHWMSCAFGVRPGTPAASSVSAVLPAATGRSAAKKSTEAPPPYNLLTSNSFPA